MEEVEEIIVLEQVEQVVLRVQVLFIAEVQVLEVVVAQSEAEAEAEAVLLQMVPEEVLPMAEMVEQQVVAGAEMAELTLTRAVLLVLLEQLREEVGEDLVSASQLQ